MGDYLNPAYPASVDERAVDEWQMPSIFEYDQAHTTNPMVYLREGWYGIGSLSQVAFAGGQSITDQSSNLLISNLDVTTVTGVTGVFSNTDVSSISVSTVTGTTVVASNADVGYVDVGSLAIAGTDVTATATELNRYNDESGLIKTMSMASYTILDTDEYSVFKAVTSTADITLALPTASANKGRIVHAYKDDATSGALYVMPEGTELLNGDSQAQINLPYGNMTALCDGANWTYFTKTGTASSDGHVQAGTFILIPENERTDGWDVNDNSLSATFETADLSNRVSAGTTTLYGLVWFYTTSTTYERAVIVTRGDGTAASDHVGARTGYIYGDIGTNELGVAFPCHIYAPSGVFEYAQWATTYPVDIFRFVLWGYYVK